MAYSSRFESIGDFYVTKRARNNTIRAMSIVSVILIWWIASLFYPPSLIPGPMRVLNEMIDIVLNQRFFHHFRGTIVRVAAAFFIALFLSTTAGIIMGVSEVGEKFFEMYVLIGLTIPALAIAMFSLMVFGITEISVIVAVFITITPMMTENMWQGAKNIDMDLVQMGHSFDANRRKVISEIIIPQIVPYVLAASRFGLGLAWKVVVIAEMLGMGYGVGYKLNESFQLFDLAGVIGWTLTFTLVMGFIEFGLISPIERYLTRWQVNVEGVDLI